MTDMGNDLSSLLEATKTPASQPDITTRPEKTERARPKKPRPSVDETEPQSNPQPGKPEDAAETLARETGDVGTGNSADGPRYLTFMRKEARIAQTQADQLSSIARSLNMARKGRGERITDNTLIRIAIGLLLERRDELNGTTEAALFRSLGLSPEG
ncbi:hypothetical protein AB0K08_16295 [Citricoccus sp. NPDC055426]|uniref:hypothetical protein n=1 Tax=Citricoccus sp. NPDC055426 TaxID=3155536 RepID=UPI003424269E